MKTRAHRIGRHLGFRATEHHVAAPQHDISAAVASWNNGDAYRDGSLRILVDAGLVEHQVWPSRRGWVPTPAGIQAGLRTDHLNEARESHRVADFNTLDDLISHAARDLGATHVSGAGPQTKIYFPRGGQFEYEEASVRRKGGYWHADGPGAREGVARLPAGARPIAGHVGRRAAEERFKLAAPRPGGTVRDYIAVDRRGQTIAGPFKSYGDAKSAAGGGGTVKFVPSRAHAAEAKRGGKADPRAVAFFRKHAGGVVGREDEYARDLAHAEQEATARGWAVEWHEDPDGWDSLGDIDPETVKEVLYAVIKDENGKVLGSLGSIVDPDRTYGRVVEAELALEALSRGVTTEARPRPKAKRSARRRR